MCHLAGYIGRQNAIPIIIDSLRIQEAILGAQATGLAVIKDDRLLMEKDIGPVKTFEEKYDLGKLASTIGIGHTRFASKSVTRVETNTKEKAHPFWSSDKKFVAMHNGIISNYLDFIEELEKKGYQFKSKSKYFNGELEEEVIDLTDSEIFTYLLQEELKNTKDMKQAIKNSCKDLRGSFAFVVLHSAHPDKIFLANWMQPMYIAFSKDSSFFCSFEIGYEPIKKLMHWKSKPPLNSLITLERGRVSLEPLLPERSLPNYKPDRIALEELLLQAIKEGCKSIASMRLFLKEHCNELGLSIEEWEELSTITGFTFSPDIYDTLIKLGKDEKVIQKLELVSEGGIAKTPRLQFFLK